MSTLPGMTSIQKAIDAYHALLTDEVAQEADHIMRTRQRERGLYFGERPLCVVLRPHFYYEQDWQFMKNGLESLLSAFARAHEICMQNADHRAALHLDPYEEELFSLDTGGPVPWTSSRLDTFYVVENRGLKCVEYNAETPAGIGYGDILVEVFDELPSMKMMQQKYHMNCTPSMGNLLNALLDAYKVWGGKDSPQIAIVDWREVPTLNEHEITRIFFEKHGIKTLLADPRDMEFRDGHLWKDDFRIDIVYKRVLYSELIERLGMDSAIVRAIKNRAVFITNSPSAKLMAKKASLAFLSDERNAHLFNARQLGAIHAHIPWTRVVSDRKTSYNGGQIDLIDFIANNRENLVLKPNDEYGGKGVVMGWTCTPEEWQATLQSALELPYVVQEKVPVVQRDFPMMLDGQLNISSRFVDADPYAFGGSEVHGCLTRLSPLALLNVTAGGGSVVPAYIISEK